MYHLALLAPPALVANGYSVSHLGAAAAGTRNMTLGGSVTLGGVGVPSVPRNVVITVTHASSVVAMSGVITGYDVGGEIMTEAWSVTATGTTKTFTGKKAFKRVTSITETVAADASANSIVAGTGIVFGITVKTTVPSAVKEMQDAAVITTGTVVAFSTASTDDPLGTYTPAVTPDGIKNYNVWVISDDPWNS